MLKISYAGHLIPGCFILVNSSLVDSTRSVHPADDSSWVDSSQVDSSHSTKNN